MAICGASAPAREVPVSSARLAGSGCWWVLGNQTPSYERRPQIRLSPGRRSPHRGLSPVRPEGPRRPAAGGTVRTAGRLGSPGGAGPRAPRLGLQVTRSKAAVHGVTFP